MTYRAAYTRETADRGEYVLTTPDHQTLSDEQLLAEGLRFGKTIDPSLTEEDIEVGDWTE